MNKTVEAPDEAADQPRLLPGDLLMWVLIVSELAVFSVGLIAFLSVRLSDPLGFSAAQDQLHRTSAAINTGILITSGWCAALALQATRAGARKTARLRIAAAAALGALFLFLKGVEYADAISKGLSTETHPFFTFYYLLTGFHAAHVIAGIIVLGLVSIRLKPDQVEAGAQFWHMVDLVWVVLFPIIYLLR